MSALGRIVESSIFVGLGTMLAYVALGPLPGTKATPAASATAVVAPAPEAPPPCVRETCAERPKALHGRVGTCGGGFCATYDIEYERHCDCVEWAPRAPKDGGP